LAAVFSATYIGGSMNMVAVTQAVELEPTIASAALAADNLVGVLYLAFLALFPSFILINKWFEHNNKATTATSVDNNAVHEEEAPTPINLQHIAFALGLSFTICAIGKVIATALGISGYSILFITAISLICANLFPKRLEKLKGDYEIGMFFMYLFFAALGVNANVEALLDKSLVIIAYAFYIVCCHAIVLLVGSKLLKINLDEVLIASSACAVGPASAAAIAASRGRKDLIASGVLIGVLGYAVANFIGVAINLSLS